MLPAPSEPEVNENAEEEEEMPIVEQILKELVFFWLIGIGRIGNLNGNFWMFEMRKIKF